MAESIEATFGVQVRICAEGYRFYQERPAIVQTITLNLVLVN